MLPTRDSPKRMNRALQEKNRRVESHVTVPEANVAYTKDNRVYHTFIVFVHIVWCVEDNVHMYIDVPI